ncbi:MAG: LysE family transporter, partial [Hyphomicrobiales bacterium]|nr:LysE family transporter [Hyphomicrobiales bacterium]
MASALVELTPGPNMGYLAALAASRGAGAGLRTTAGIATGIAAVGVLCAFGLAELVAGHPTLDRALRWAGAVFMLWLAFDAFVHAGAAATGGAGDLSTFRRGLTTNLM